MVFMNTLAGLLNDAFGQDIDGFPPSCWVREACAEACWPYSAEAIEVVTAHGARQQLCRRLRLEHPAASAHHPQHDDRLHDALVEAEAFAWAVEVAQLGIPEFCFAERMPDLRIPGRAIIEVKAVRHSVEEQLAKLALLQSGAARTVSRGPADDAVYHKLDDKLSKAQEQLAASPEIASRVVYFNVRLDFDVSSREDSRLSEWARDGATRTGLRLVVVRNGEWWEPLIDTGG